MRQNSALAPSSGARSGHPYSRTRIWRGATFGVRRPVVLMADQFAPRLRDPLPGRLPKFLAGFGRLVRQRGMRHRTGSNRKKSVHFGGSLHRSYVSSNPLSSPLRLPLRGWLRPSLPLSLHGQGGAKGRYRPSQRGLRACGFADIPTPLPIQNKTKEVYVMFSINLESASLALDASANTSALVRQRFSSTSATVIALLLKTPPPQSVTGSALPSQHLAANRPLPWGSA